MLTLANPKAARHHWSCFRQQQRCLIVLTVIFASHLTAADVMDAYEWKPINIGAGGWADGIICSETDPNVRFVRTDTGQYYRWSAADNFWLPMVVQHEDGSGFGKAIIPEPSHNIQAKGNDGGSFALDPNDNKTLYLYISLGDMHYSPTFYGGLPANIYKSTDGGKNFSATHFNDTAKFTLKTNDTFLASFRQDGECLTADPNNSKVVYVGTGTRGIFKSTDGGDTWQAMRGDGLPTPAGVNDINVLPYRKGGVITVNGVTVSKIIDLVYANGQTVYALPPNNDKTNSNAQSGVYQSTDGGQTWKNLTADGKGPGPHSRGGVLDQNTGSLYVRISGGKQDLWKYEANAWKKIYDTGPVDVVAVDPKNPGNLMVTGGWGGGKWGISTDGGKTWNNIPFSGKSPASGNHAQGFSGNDPKRGCAFGCLSMDVWGNMWLIEGNDGVLRWKFDPKATTIDFIPDTAGVENFCADDLVFPKNGNGRIVVSVQDDNGMIINNPDTFDLTLFKARQGLCNGLTISVCPNDPNTIAILGYCTAITFDNGKTITPLDFKPIEKLAAEPKKLGRGSLQLSRRGKWSAGEDHLVWVFNNTAFYSRDGGKTWQQTKTDLEKIEIPTSPWTANFNVVADPFVADKFYVHSANGLFWTTTNGGETWTKGTAPSGNNTGCWVLRTNYEVQNDLWSETYAGLYHSKDAGVTWNEVKGNNGISIHIPRGGFALGKGSGKPGDAPYTVYYVHTENTSHPARDSGIYRSTTAGARWERISRRPTGLMCPGVIGASWDTYGLVGVAVAGQGFVYGKPKKP